MGSTASCPTGSGSCTRSTGRRGSASCSSRRSRSDDLPGQEGFLGNLYAFGALLSFTFAHASVARLRAKKKDVARPYRGPGNVNIRSYDAPMFAIVGGTFTSSRRRHRRPVPDGERVRRRLAGAGIVVFVAYRRRQGLDLTSTHKVAIAQPVVDHEAEYDSVLVHFGDSGYDDQVLATARKLAARKRRGIHVLVTITVPNSMEDRGADARPRRRARAASSRRPRCRGGDRVSGHVERVRAGQAGPPHRRGRRQHARGRDRDAAAAPDRRRVAVRQDARDRATERPCRVIIESSPDGARRGRRPARVGVLAQ